ncbi:hypothetical protein [Streptomyces violaceusniger]|uniref:Uncharacterized protein n=1 Tax=Streptomyces violaceusniger TaxID=68280 RepID=A0A4D4LFQ0_STRVO|nr:hypothetical protein SVIO_079710 [Streptomyces violaceusniger]
MALPGPRTGWPGKGGAPTASAGTLHRLPQPGPLGPHGPVRRSFAGPRRLVRRLAPRPGYRREAAPGYRREAAPGYRREAAPGYRREAAPGYRREAAPGYRREAAPGYRREAAASAPDAVAQRHKAPPGDRP